MISKILCLLIISFFLSGCESLRYYHQAARGHFEVMSNSQPINKLLQKETITPALKQKLRFIQDVRQFATQQLKLPDNKSYNEYADIGRPYVVWSVFAAQPYSFDAVQSCYLLIGCLNYRGYYAIEDANHYAKKLSEKGLDVYVSGVKAYSTLGWFSDPVLNTFIGYNELDLAALIFHELAHQLIYVSGDTAFNESFASAVAQIGLRYWLEKKQNMDQFALYQIDQQKHRQFIQLIQRYRLQLTALYQKKPADIATKKQTVFQRLNLEYLTIKATWQDQSGYEGFFTAPLNNAKLNTVAIYHDHVAAFLGLFAQHHNDFEVFYKAVGALGKLSPANRGLVLKKLAK